MALARPKTTKTFADATIESTLTVDQTTLTVDSSNDRVGVGTSTPSVQLEVQDTTTSSANTGGKLRLSANDGSPMGDSHRLGVLEFTGAEDSSNTQVVGARIEALTDAAWTNAENGCALYFYTTDGNASQSNVLKIDSNKKSTFNGVIDITDTTDASDDTGDTGALRVEGGASIAKKLYVGTDLDVDGTANLDNVDIDGTLVVDGSNISLDSTSTLNIDNSNTSSGITIGTATSGVPISIGHTTSETTVNDNLTVTGDLTVNGTTTTINSTTLTVDDKTIVIASGAADSSAADGAGISIDGASATLLYDHTGTQWEMNKPLEVTGNISTTGDLAVDGTSNLDEVDIDGATQIDATLSVGVNDTGYDVKFFGDTASAYMQWDASEDDLILGGAARVVIPDGQLVLASTAVSSTAAELNKLDGADSNVTAAKLSTLSALTDTEIGYVDGAGTSVVASKAIVADSNKDVGTIRNLTIDGTFSDGNYTFDTSGNVTGLGNVTMTGDLTVSGGDIIYGNGQHATLDIADVSGTNTAGKNLTILAGASTGSGSGGSIIFQTADGGSSGSSVNSHATALTIEDDGKITAAGKLVVNNKLTVGVDDTGYDVQFFGATSGASFLWDESADDLILSGVAGLIVPDGQLTLGSTAVTSTAAELNLLDGVSGLVQADFTKLAAVDSTAAEINLLDGSAKSTSSITIADDDAFIIIDGTTTKQIPASDLKTYAGSGSGASALNDLSDVSYSSGDLTITSLDLLTTSDTAHNAAGTGVVIRGGNTTAGTTNNIAGGSLSLQGGRGKGTGEGGSIVFQTAKAAGGAGSSLNSLTTRLTINHKGTVSFGNAQDGELGLDNTAHDTAGKALTIFGGAPDEGTTNNIAGGDVVIEGGKGKGTGDGGDIKFKVYKAAGGAGSSYNSSSTILKIKSNKSAKFTGEVYVGEDDSGHDVQFFGATSGAYMLWDESEDDLIMGGAARIVVPDGQLILGSTALSSTASEIDAICDTGGRTAAAVAVADDHFLFYDGGASGASKVESIADFISAVASTGLTASSGTLVNGACTNTVTTADITLDASHNGSTIIIMELGATRTYTLPAPTANYRIKFYAVQNNLTYNIIVKTASASDRIIGLFARLDYKTENEHGYETGSFSGSTANELHGSGHSDEMNHNKFEIVDVISGSVWELYSDGTRWYVWGHMVSAAGGTNVTTTFGLYS